MYFNYRIGALTLRVETDFLVTETEIAELFRCEGPGRLLCVCRGVDQLRGEYENKIYSEENLNVYRGAEGLHLVRYAQVPHVHPYVVSTEHYDGRRIDIAFGTADLNWSSQISYLWRSISLRHNLIRAANLLMHASYVDIGGKGVLFAGPMAAEQAECWAKSRGTTIINSDRAVIGVENGQVMAYGVPLTGRGHICKNLTLPLAAIVMAEPVGDKLTQLTGASAMAAVRRFVACDGWRDGEYAMALSLLDDMLGRVPVLRLPMGGESGVLALEQAGKHLR